MLYLAKRTTLVFALIGDALLRSCTQDYNIASCITVDQIESEYAVLLTDVLSTIGSTSGRQNAVQPDGFSAALAADSSILRLTFASAENRTSLGKLPDLERDVGWIESDLFSGYSRELTNQFRQLHGYQSVVAFARHKSVQSEGAYSDERMHTWKTGLERGYMVFPDFRFDILRLTRYYVTQDRMYELVLTLDYGLVIERVAACGRGTAAGTRNREPAAIGDTRAL